MNRLVYTVFKTIALSIIFIFLFDIIFYMYRVTSLNARMESLSTSMKKVVMENNYLPSEMAETYSEIFKNMICDYNNVPYHPGMSGAQLINGDGGNAVDGTNGNSVNAAAFIAGMHWNYNSNATGLSLSSLSANRQKWTGSGWSTQNTNIIKTKMNSPANYGDIMVVQLRVGVFQPIWGWATSGYAVTDRYSYNGEDVRRWVRNAASTEMVYTYYVPCLNFRTITSG